MLRRRLSLGRKPDPQPAAATGASTGGDDESDMVDVPMEERKAPTPARKPRAAAVAARSDGDEDGDGEEVKRGARSDDDGSTKNSSDDDDDDDDEDEEEGNDNDDEEETEDRPASRGASKSGGENLDQLSQEIKTRNVEAVRSNSIAVRRSAVLPFLTVPQDKLHQPFKRPDGSGEAGLSSAAKRRPLGMRLRLCAPMGSKPFTRLPSTAPTAVVVVEEPKGPIIAEQPPPEVERNAADYESDDEEFEPLVLWEPPPQSEGADPEALPIPPVIVDKRLSRKLRQHQREGIQFMFDCVTGQRELGRGCILADDMGLGKTCQSVSLIWTLLRQGPGGKRFAKRVIVVCPTSLVNNWAKEFEKWLPGLVSVMALSEASREKVVDGITEFLKTYKYDVCIISYETFRMHAEKFASDGSCDLLVCDEAHRLKNDKTLTCQALDSLPCKSRVLLSGTPMQNDLAEFFAMVEFTNPGALGTASHFRKHFELPVLKGREPDATDSEREVGMARSAELSAIVNQFILRRTNSLLSDHLPPKLVQIVVCKPSQLQTDLYKHFLHSKQVKLLLDGRQTKVLSSITALKKLCNHPKLIYDAVHSYSGNSAHGFEDCDRFFPEDFKRSRSSMPELSGKFELLHRMLTMLRETTDDRIVLVSNYTQTLDLFAAMLRELNFPYLRLDGTTTASKRQRLVDKFNDMRSDQFAFLLSSKAGGCGLNLVGGNRLILFDPDWNPATDKQAAARVWRDGQRKRVYIYRFLAAGTLEEKVYQRQLSKEGLQGVVSDDKIDSNAISSEELRDLFQLVPDSMSDTHDKLKCMRCGREGTTTACPKPLPSPIAKPKKAPAPAPTPAPAAPTPAPVAATENASPEVKDNVSEASRSPMSDGKSDISMNGPPIKCPLGSQYETEDIDMTLLESPIEITDDDGIRSFAASAEGGFRSFIESQEDAPAPPKETKPKGKKSKKDKAAEAEEAEVIKPEEPSEPVLPPVPGECVPQIGHPAEEDLANWSHHCGVSTVDDVILQAAGAESVSFVFGLQVEGRDLSEFKSVAPIKPGDDPGNGRGSKRRMLCRPADPAGSSSGGGGESTPAAGSATPSRPSGGLCRPAGTESSDGLRKPPLSGSSALRMRLKRMRPAGVTPA